MINFIFYHTPFFYLIQSIWRDEAFSYFMAKPNLLKIIVNTANDFNPPLYYFLLHFWINLFGHTDTILRILSFIFHILTAYVGFLLAKNLFSGRFPYFVTIFTFLNPMLLYYAFEIRMYSLYAFFTICSLYFFYIKKWKWYVIFTVLGLYTHSFFPLILISFIFYLVITRKTDKKQILLILSPVVFYIPWVPLIFLQFLNSKNSWLFPVDTQLIFSVLGNLFTSFEGTPGNWWIYTGLFSGIIFIFFLLSLRKKRDLSLLMLTPIFLPLIIILGYSILKRPLYVNRYLIFITVFEIFGVSLGIWNIKNTTIRALIASLWIIAILIFNFTMPPYRKKTDFKSTFSEINKLAKINDYVFAKTPIGFLESAYYFKDQNKVFIYNPYNIKIPNYIGVNVVFPDVSKASLPVFPSRTFLVYDNADYEIVINRK